MELLSLNSVFPLVFDLYGVEPDEDSFEEMALAAWNRINNKHTRLYRFVGDTKDRQLQLPCNATEIIESVHIPLTEVQLTSNKVDFVDWESVMNENYIDAWHGREDPFNQRGTMVKYKEGDKVLYFNRNYKHVMVVYQGILVDDEDELPLITEKEQDAIACFVAYATLRKEALKTRNKDTMAFAQTLLGDWKNKCSAARVPAHISQNDMNKILDARVRWDRKSYNKSWHPIK